MTLESSPNPTPTKGVDGTTSVSQQPGRAIDYDVKVYSLMGGNPHSTIGNPPDVTILDHSLCQCAKYLTSVAKTADGRRPWAIGEFKALVFSLGGLMEKDTALEMSKWRREMSDTIYGGMTRRISLALLRARAKLYEG